MANEDATDTKIVDAAYAAQVTNLFNVFYMAIANAGDDAKAKKAAESAFSRGLVLARYARERAHALVK